MVESFTRFFVQPLTLAVMSDALDTKDRYGLSYWDAAIIEAGRHCGCDTELSEDLDAGPAYGGVRVVNPFE